MYLVCVSNLEMTLVNECLCINSILSNHYVLSCYIRPVVTVGTTILILTISVSATRTAKEICPDIIRGTCQLAFITSQKATINVLFSETMLYQQASLAEMSNAFFVNGERGHSVCRRSWLTDRYSATICSCHDIITM